METRKELAKSSNRISISMSDIEALFTLLDNLANREEVLLEQFISTACKNWIEIASENILNKVEGYSIAERHTIKVVLQRELLVDRFKDIFLRMYQKGVKLDADRK